MSRQQTRETDLGNDKIGGLLFKLALPAIMAQVINLLYNLVDRMYIGHINEVVGSPHRRWGDHAGDHGNFCFCSTGKHGRCTPCFHYDGKR